MKILCVIDSLGSGGAQRQLVELAKGFKEKGHEVSFLIYHNIIFFKEDLDVKNIPLTIIVEKNYLFRILKMRKAIRKLKPNAVLSFLEGANFICELAGLPIRRWKLVVGERSADPNIRKSMKLKVFRWFHCFADAVVANSKKNIELIKKVNPFLPNKKYSVIYNIIDIEKWVPKMEFKFKRGKKLKLVITASHQYNKNSKGLIEALNSLEKGEKERIMIEWYGDESPDNSFKEANALIKKYSLNNIIKFYPVSKNIDKKIQDADIVGLFSFCEGLPNSICEGMSMAKPVLVSNVSDLSTIINHTSWCLFDPNDVNEIKTVISKYLNISSSELLRIGKLNRERALELFEQEKNINLYLKLLK